MAWDAFIDRIEKEEKGIVVIATFTDNVSQKFQQDFHFSSGTKESVLATVISKLNGLNSVNTLPSDIPLGKITIPSSPEPTSEEIARSKYLQDLSRYRQMSRAIELGIKNDTDSDFTDLAVTLKANFLDGYLDLF